MGARQPCCCSAAAGRVLEPAERVQAERAGRTAGVQHSASEGELIGCLTRLLGVRVTACDVRGAAMHASWDSLCPALGCRTACSISLPALCVHAAPLAPPTMQLSASRVVYVPDLYGPTDSAGSWIGPELDQAEDEELLMSDGSGFISSDLAALVPAIAAGQISPVQRGQGVMWPHTPLQVRVRRRRAAVWLLCMQQPAAAAASERQQPCACTGACA